MTKRMVTVVGGGMVALKFAELLSRLDPATRITVIGDEPPYDRTRLVDVLVGACREDAISLNGRVFRGRVAKIDRADNRILVATEDGQTASVGYDTLVLATGAEAARLPIPGIERACVVRRLRDVERIRAADARKVTIIGGGVLGVEIAQALNHEGREVSLVHSSRRLMHRQLDEKASESLLTAMQRAGIECLLEATTTEIGDGFVETLTGPLQCDLAILATGGVPSDDLAKEAGLSCDRGVLVDDDMRTSDPRIFAIGDCARHGGLSLGQVGPGYEQARIAAQAILAAHRTASGPSRRPRTVSGFSLPRPRSEWQAMHAFRGHHEAKGGAIAGVADLGTWGSHRPLQDFLSAEWNRLSSKFRAAPRAGAISDPAYWADEAIICKCRHVDKSIIMSCVAKGADNVAEIGVRCGAGSGCGGCKHVLAQLLCKSPDPIRYHLLIGAVGILIAVFATLTMTFPIPYPASFDVGWDIIWRSHLAKQLSGYFLLAVGVLLSLIGLRKRARKLSFGSFDGWRLFHSLLGVLAVVGVLVHSGGRFGGGIAFVLSLSWFATILTGSGLALVAAKSHAIPGKARDVMRRILGGLHIAALWGLPVLIGFHIAAAYMWR